MNNNLQLLILLLITLAACQTEQKPQKAAILQAVADSYGIENFDKVDKMAYTFKVQMGQRNVARSWVWEPKKQQVTVSEDSTEYTFNETALHTKEDSTAHSKFINDKYWLLFPFQLVWDTGFTHEVKKEVLSPIKSAKTTQLTIKYNGEDGYTPGDTYTLYLDKNHHIKEWAYTPAGKEEPALITQWEEPKDFNGIKISTQTSNAEGNFLIWFDGVAVE